LPRAVLPQTVSDVEVSISRLESYRRQHNRDMCQCVRKLVSSKYGDIESVSWNIRRRCHDQSLTKGRTQSSHRTFAGE
jgi:hypothetical protein